jgi:ABC-2 type transport system permease protein
MKAIRRMMQEPEEEEILLLTEPLAPEVRSFGLLNWRGMATLTAKEIKRFLKIPVQTILSPLVMTLLFVAVFAVGLHGAPKLSGVPFLQFVVPGLIMMSIAQSAFVNASSSLILSKLQGNIVDILMPPLSPVELTVGYAVSGVVRGVLVGLVSFGVLFAVMSLPIHHAPVILYFAVMGSLMLSLMGLITGIWASKFDHMVAIQNFLIMPATFLSGTFFSLSTLPEQWKAFCLVNPFFYMIDGFRYGFTGVADGPLLGGAAYLLLMNIVLFNIAYWMFARGTHLKT